MLTEINMNNRYNLQSQIYYYEINFAERIMTTRFKT